MNKFKNLRKILIHFFPIFLSCNLYAKNCEINISGTDMMKFDKEIIDVKGSCKVFKILLKHTGKLQKNVMGHNIVIVKTKDLEMVTSKINMSHGFRRGFLPDLNEVLFKSPIIGGGEEIILEIETEKLMKDTNYTFFCSFPGHFVIMKGEVRIL